MGAWATNAHRNRPAPLLVASALLSARQIQSCKHPGSRRDLTPIGVLRREPETSCSSQMHCSVHLAGTKMYWRAWCIRCRQRVLLSISRTRPPECGKHGKRAFLDTLYARSLPRSKRWWSACPAAIRRRCSTSEHAAHGSEPLTRNFRTLPGQRLLGGLSSGTRAAGL